MAKTIEPRTDFNNKRHRLEVLRSQLDAERATFLPVWRDLGDFILPRRPRFNVADVDRGERRNLKIIDSTATMAARTLRSGMMAGITSPARPWFRLSTPDPDLAKFGRVKDWLYFVDERMRVAFLRSNVYHTLPIIYGDIGVFATSSMMIEEDFTGAVFRAYPFPIGSYYLAQDERLKVSVFMRDFRMTVRQLIKKFGKIGANGQPDWSVFSPRIKQMWISGQMETWIDVVHCVIPNDDHDPLKLHSKFKKFSSYYFERGMTKTSQTDVWNMNFLRESGYDYFPVLGPRWEVTAEDVYGTECPGITAIGDTKALQHLHKRKAQAIDKLVNPPMSGPTSLKSAKTSLLPGDVTYVDVREGQKGFVPVYQVDPKINEMLLDIRDHQERIKRSFYEDLFLMLASDDRLQPRTAEEIAEKKEEKLLALGPVLEQLNQDLLDPLIDNVFDIMLRQGLIPPPPPELQGMELKVEYISIMAQAQKLVGLAGIDKFTEYTVRLGEVNPSVFDKVNMDEMVDHVAETTGVPPTFVRHEDEVAAIRNQKAQQAKAAAIAEHAPAMAGAAKDLSETQLGGDNALQRLLDSAKAGQLVQQ